MQFNAFKVGNATPCAVPACEYVKSATWIVPLTVAGVAGGVVYPRSPLMTTPNAVLVYVLARMPKVLAAPRGIDAENGTPIPPGSDIDPFAIPSESPNPPSVLLV